MTAEIYQALDGHRMGTYTLRMGTYNNGRIAITADGPEGPECVVTVNLVGVLLAPDEFLVRTETRRYSEPVFQAMVNSGIAHPTGHNVYAGGVNGYAEVWKFSLTWHDERNE